MRWRSRRRRRARVKPSARSPRAPTDREPKMQAGCYRDQITIASRSTLASVCGSVGGYHSRLTCISRSSANSHCQASARAKYAHTADPRFSPAIVTAKSTSLSTRASPRARLPNNLTSEIDRTNCTQRTIVLSWVSVSIGRRPMSASAILTNSRDGARRPRGRGWREGNQATFAASPMTSCAH
jgi:hypothetical protein